MGNECSTLQNIHKCPFSISWPFGRWDQLRSVVNILIIVLLTLANNAFFFFLVKNTESSCPVVNLNIWREHQFWRIKDTNNNKTKNKKKNRHGHLVGLSQLFRTQHEMVFFVKGKKPTTLLIQAIRINTRSPKCSVVQSCNTVVASRR